MRGTPHSGWISHPTALATVFRNDGKYTTMVALVGIPHYSPQKSIQSSSVKYPSMIRDHTRSSEIFKQNGPREEGLCFSGTIMLQSHETLNFL